MLFPLWAAKTAHSLCAAGGCGILMHAAQAACHSPECRCVLFMQRKELLLECTRLQSSCGPDRFEQRSHALIRVSPLRRFLLSVCIIRKQCRSSWSALAALATVASATAGACAVRH